MDEHPHITKLREGAVSFEESRDALGGLFEELHALTDCPQDPEWHAEGDVATHTGMVIDELEAWLTGQGATSGDDALVLRLAALLHDIAKPRTTTRRTYDGRERVVAPGHARAGASYIMHLLAEPELGLEHALQMRVLAAVAHHHDPKLLIVRDKPMSAFKMLAWRARPEDLWALELADMRGRTCPDGDDQVELIELYRLGCEEAGCWGDPARGWGEFVANVRDGMSEVEDVAEVERAVLEGVWALGQGEIYTPEEAVARSYEGRGDRAHVTLMYGPSGSGKSTWAREWAADQGAELIRLDALRAQLRGKEGDQRANGQVIQLAREQLKAGLRAGKPVVWDATSLRREHRAAVLDTARRYGAHTTLAVMHVGWSVAAERNKGRTESVPEAALARQRQGVQYPEVDEAHRVLWLSQEGEVLADTRERWMEMSH